MSLKVRMFTVQELTKLVNQFRVYEENIFDRKIVEKILISVTEKYDSIVIVIEKSKDISNVLVTELMGSLEAYGKNNKP